jgi:hypothetical protein
MLNVYALSVVKLNVIFLSVVALMEDPKIEGSKLATAGTTRRSKNV